MTSQGQKPIGKLILFLGAGILAISASAILIRLSQTPPLGIAFWRITFSIVLLAPLWLQKKRWQELFALPSTLRWQLFGSSLFLGLHFWTWISSLQYTSVAASVLLVCTNPIWIGLLSPWVLKEKLSRRTWLGIGIAMVGASTLALSSEGGGAVTPNPLLGNFLAIVGAWGATGYLMMGRKVRPHLDLWSYASVTLWGAWIVLACGVHFTSPSFSTSTMAYISQEWHLFLLMALFPQMIGHNSVSWSLRYLRADTVSVLLLLEPIGSTILAIFFLNEFPKPIVLLAGPILLLGVAVVVRNSRNL